jgi:ppGpp synthetase/RelA/SpoT-type nucleotidyltranferase
MTNHVEAEYRRRFEQVLQTAAANLEQLLVNHLRDVAHVDRISARAKNPLRFAEKAQRRENGVLKYTAPLEEVQDQIGARVVVLYRDDVEIVTEVINRYFPHIEEREVQPDDHWKFGYFGKHFILALPMDVIPVGVDRDDAPRVFELQIKTLFQHAWSEANHDLGYKAANPLSDDQERRFAYTAAQAWGADRVFEELRIELDEAGRRS